ncbi:Hypothetical protein NGAL_HAMBI2605_59100 [Neorhizobium galegae bv. orientalis]|nr:Hypothetical protein NGAL_HAMBI2605_59100 [Neorhizobium galegae bv. orientalis]
MTDTAGLLEQGNIDLTKRPVVKNDDGSISTVRSMSFGEDGSEILIPTVSPDGKILGDDDAIALYRSSGQHLGKFKSPADASAYAERLHENQAKLYAKPQKPDTWRGWGLRDPSSLPKSISEGPVSWGEAWSRAAETTDDTMRVIENTNAGSDALEKAYDQRIGLISDLTGVQLANPMRVASGVDRDMAAVFAAQAAGGGTALPSQVSPDYLRLQEEEFNARAAELADRDPKIAGIIARPILDERNRVMRDAERDAGLAAQNPELGMLGRLSAQVAGGLTGAARDPAQWGMAFLGAGGSTAKTVAGRIGQTIMTEAMINGGQELVLQGISQDRKAAAGLEHGMGDMLANAGIAATFGALFGGTVQGGAELARVFKLGEGGEALAARVLEGRPEPGDIETMAKAMNIDLTPDRLDLINRSFEDRVLDEVMISPDASPAEARVFEAAQRYAEDPDNNPPPDIVERLVADEEAGLPSRFSPDEYERMFAGDPNAIDDIGDTFFADTVDDAARNIDAVADRVDAIGEQVEAIRPTRSDGTTVEVGGGDLPERGVVVANIHDDGRVYIGNPGDVHFSLAERYGREEFGSPEFTGFINADGRIMDREEAFRWVSENEQPVRPSENMGEQLDALDYREQVPAARQRPGNRPTAAAAVRADPLEGQTIRPANPVEPRDDAAIVAAEVQAGDIVEPARDANGNPENFLDFIAVEDGDGNVKIMSAAEALEMADEPDLLADVLESCKL